MFAITRAVADLKRICRVKVFPSARVGAVGVFIELIRRVGIRRGTGTENIS
jgi:hypothetical protein